MEPQRWNENSIASAIGFLERTYKVNYDQKNMEEVGRKFPISSKSSSQIVGTFTGYCGIIFSILDQFQNKASYVSNGRLIRIDNSGRNFELRGGNFAAKLFAGFTNWLGHIMSDAAGSTGSRGSGGRGSGVPMPFMELTQFCKFGRFQERIGRHSQKLWLEHSSRI